MYSDIFSWAKPPSLKNRKDKIAIFCKTFVYNLIKCISFLFKTDIMSLTHKDTEGLLSDFQCNNELPAIKDMLASIKSWDCGFWDLHCGRCHLFDLLPTTTTDNLFCSLNNDLQHRAELGARFQPLVMADVRLQIGVCYIAWLGAWSSWNMTKWLIMAQMWCSRNRRVRAGGGREEWKGEETGEKLVLLPSCRYVSVESCLPFCWLWTF